MKRAFHFRLARVARVRDIFETVARADFAEAQGIQNRMEQRCEELRQAIQSGYTNQATIQATTIGSLDITALLAREQSIVHLQQLLEESCLKVEELALLTEAKRAAWQARKQDCNALEQLEDRDREKHRSALFEVENEEFEESSQQTYMRRRNSDLSDSAF